MRTGTRYFLPAWPVLIGLFLSFESAKFRLTDRGINLLDSMLGLSTVALPGVLFTACFAAVIVKFRNFEEAFHPAQAADGIHVRYCLQEYKLGKKRIGKKAKCA